MKEKEIKEKEIKEIEKVFKMIENIDNKIKGEKANELKILNSALPDIAYKINEVYIKREERLKSTKGRFNLFTTLLGIGDETRLHSRFITHLLNPQGNHDCGYLFLNLFIDILVNEDNIENFKEIKNKKCNYARTEQSTDSGRRIDIYLEFKKCKIAIENKIWASEQPKQIADYAKFIDANDKNNFLFYLTLNGKESETSSNATYFPISYETHILKWLEKCLQATYKYININQEIQQYQNVIKELTNNKMEKEEMEEIKNLIKENPVIIKYQNEINNEIGNIKLELECQYWDILLKDLEVEKYSINLHEDKKQKYYLVKHENYNDLYFGLIRNIPDNFMMIGISKELANEETKNIYTKLTNELLSIYKKSCEKYKGGYHSNWLAGTFHLYSPGDYFSNNYIQDRLLKSDIKEKAKKDAIKVIEYLKFIQKEWDDLKR